MSNAASRPERRLVSWRTLILIHLAYDLWAQPTELTTHALPIIGGGATVAQDQHDDATLQATCYSKGCDLPAGSTCERCHHRFCADHVRHQTIERRVYRDETGFRPGLERPLSRFEAHTLCIRCSTKPFTGDPSAQALGLP